MTSATYKLPEQSVRCCKRLGRERDGKGRIKEEGARPYKKHDKHNGY
jgi:hypothetical protein